MRLLVVTQSVDVSNPVLGFFHGWIKEFAKHSELVTVIALGVGEYKLPQNVRVFSLGKEQHVSRLGYIFNFYRFIWRERKNYDVVFVHMNPVYVILGGLPWRVLGKKIGLWYTHKHVDLKLRIAEKLSDIIFTASRESFRLASNKVNVMGHGIDTEKFKPVENKKQKKFYVITIGRISPVKDYRVLVEAADALVRDNVQIEVDIIGEPVTFADKEYFEEMRALLREKKLEHIVRFVGAVPNKDIPSYLGKADVFVNMSHTGSLDKAVLEAMACGIPVITSNQAFKEIFEGEMRNLLISPNDSLALAKKINELSVLDAEKKGEIARHLRDIVREKHNIESLIPRILSCYEAGK